MRNCEARQVVPAMVLPRGMHEAKETVDSEMLLLQKFLAFANCNFVHHLLFIGLAPSFSCCDILARHFSSLWHFRGHGLRDGGVNLAAIRHTSPYGYLNALLLDT